MKKNNAKNNQSILKFVVKKKPIENSHNANNNIFDFIKNKMIEKTRVEETTISSNKELPVCDAIKKLNNELQNEKEENKKVQHDLSATVSLLKDASSINLQKDVCIKKLSKITPNNSEKPINLFDEFNGHFNDNQLKQLRSVPSGKSRDSSFVLALMRFLYPNASVLCKKSVTGKKRNKIAKEKLTPQKKTIIIDMLKERICSEKGVDDLSVLQRMKNVNRMIKNAIEKITMKKSETEVSNNVEPSKNQSSTNSVTGFEPHNIQNLMHFNPYFGKIFHFECLLLIDSQIIDKFTVHIFI